MKMIELLTTNFVWHIRTQIHPSLHQAAWDHFCAIMQGRVPSTLTMAEIEQAISGNTELFQ